MLGGKLQRGGLELGAALRPDQRRSVLRLGCAAALGQQGFGIAPGLGDKLRGTLTRLGKDGLDLCARPLVEKSREIRHADQPI